MGIKIVHPIKVNICFETIQELEDGLNAVERLKEKHPDFVFEIRVLKKDHSLLASI